MTLQHTRRPPSCCGYPLSILFSSQCCCHWGRCVRVCVCVCVWSTCRVVSRRRLQPAPCKKTTHQQSGQQAAPEACAWVDLETRADRITREPWQRCVRVNNSSSTICRQQRGAKVRILIANICLLQGSWWECCDHKSPNWLLHVPTTRV